MAQPVVELDRIGKVYYTGDVETPVLFDLSFSIVPGEFVAIVGGSGSGKTTLLNLMGLLDRPTAGAAYPAESPLVGVDRFVRIVRTIQTSFPGLAVIGGGYSWLRQFLPHVPGRRPTGRGDRKRWRRPAFRRCPAK